MPATTDFETFRNYLVNDPDNLCHQFRSPNLLTPFLTFADLPSNDNSLWIGSRINQNPDFDYINRRQNQLLANQTNPRVRAGAVLTPPQSLSVPGSRMEHHGSFFYDAWALRLDALYQSAKRCSHLKFQEAWNQTYNPIALCWARINGGMTHTRENVLHQLEAACQGLAKFPATPTGHLTFWVPDAMDPTKYEYLHVDATGITGLNERDVRYLLAALVANTWHNSSKVSGPGITARTDYSHDYDFNRLLAVENQDVTVRSLKVIAVGKVNDGWHRF